MSGHVCLSFNQWEARLPIMSHEEKREALSCSRCCDHFRRAVRSVESSKMLNACAHCCANGGIPWTNTMGVNRLEGNCPKATGSTCTTIQSLDDLTTTAIAAIAA